MPFEDRRGHHGGAHLRREKTGAYAKEDAGQEKGEQMRPGQNPQRKGRDEEARSERQIRFIGQRKVKTDAAAEEHRDP